MLRVRPINSADLENIRNFTDREIGKGYYSSEELPDILRRSQKNDIMCSLLLEDNETNELLGIRICFPPGQWTHGKGHRMNPELWPHRMNDTGYFQSLFIAPQVQGQGWGSRLSLETIRLLTLTGARGIVCHSWKESPDDSSGRYLRKMGFELVAEHPEYWRNLTYNCPRCKKPPCLCTAQEMYLDLERTK